MLVKEAYEGVVRKRFRVPLRISVPKQGKMADNARGFFNLAKEKKTTLEELMGEAFDCYGVDWCKKTFRTAWPPLSLAISEKIQDKLSRTVKTVRVHVVSLDSTVAQYMDILRSMDKQDAIQCVNAGWPPGPKDVREEILRKLKECLKPSLT